MCAAMSVVSACVCMCVLCTCCVSVCACVCCVCRVCLLLCLVSAVPGLAALEAGGVEDPMKLDVLKKKEPVVPQYIEEDSESDSSSSSSESDDDEYGSDSD